VTINPADTKTADNPTVDTGPLPFAVNPETKRKACVFVWVYASCAQYVGVHHSASTEFDPVTVRSFDIKLRRWLGEWKK
jgi:hypothetical protein